MSILKIFERYFSKAWLAVPAAAAVLYIFWPSSGRAMRRGLGYPGLYNSGNLCYLNSGLQALSACDSIISWCESKEYESPIIHQLVCILKGLNSKLGPKTLSSQALASELRASGLNINDDQQDVHELMVVLLEKLSEYESCQRARIKSHSLSLDDSADQKIFEKAIIGERRCMCEQTPSFCNRFPFKGSVITRQSCHSCKMERTPKKVENFFSISLYIPAIYSSSMNLSLSLDALLANHFSGETLDNVECSNCYKISNGAIEKTRQTKKLALVKSPQCLMIHLNRTYWTTFGEPAKLKNFVSFNKFLDISPYLDHFSQVCKRCCRYELKAVIVHGGEHNFGHYTAYKHLKLPKDGGIWLFTSDTFIEKSTLSSALQSCFYILFYEKIVTASKL